MIRDWPEAYKTVNYYICRRAGKPCELATKDGYCQITACAKRPDYIQAWQWMKPGEDGHDHT